MLTKKEDESFYRLEYTVFPDEKDESFRNLSHTEKEAVRIIDEYNDHILFKYFSKEKTVKEFQSKVSDEKIVQFIRPYIEKRIVRILELIQGTRVKLFTRDKGRSNIFDEDFLIIRPKQAESVFSFKRESEGTKYSLDLYYEGQRLKIKDQYVDILSNTPAVLRINNSVYFIRDIESNKIKPFFTKDSINIPQKAEFQYFKKFGLNIIKNYEVNAEGFEIHKINPGKSAGISLERGLYNNVTLTLRFRYGQKEILANNNERIFADFHKSGEDFWFDKYERDFSFEEQYHTLLNDLGLVSYDQVNYEIRGNRRNGFDVQVWNMVEFLNDNAEDLAVPELSFTNRLGGSEKFQTGKRELVLGSELNQDWFDLNALVKIGEYEIPFYKFKSHILSETRAYLLPDGSVFVIPQNWFGRFREMFEFGKIEDGQIRIHKQHFSILEKSEKSSSGKDLEKLDLLNTKEKLTDTRIPSSLTASLRPYQFEGFAWLYYLQQNNLGGCLADDMGLGKTVQAITLLLKNKEDYIPEHPSTSRAPIQPDLFSTPENMSTSLIVVPSSLVHNWKNELARFAPTLKINLYIGNQRNRKINYFSNYDIIISSYHTIRQDIELLSAFKFHYIILDESQVIKNPSSKVYKAMTMLNSDYRLALTGTPIENSLTDLWAQMNFVNEGLLGNLNFFRREFVVPIEKRNDAACEERLRKLINPFILRRTKEEVARDLPEITDQVVYCNMSDAQRTFYEEEKSTIRRSIFENIDREGLDKSAIIVLQGLTRLRQAANHPVMVDDDYHDDSGKFSEILRNIENVIAEGHKVLIFSSFVKHLELLKKEIEAQDIRYTMLTGSSTNRESIVGAFQDNPDCKVFLISLKAGGVGLNLTAADYVFILDPWWNPASEEQAVNRAHRIGQDKNVFVFRFISENSIEEKIQLLQEKKSKLAEAFVSSNNPLKNIDRAQLEKLFE